MISVCFLFFKIPLPRGGLIFLLSFSQALSRVQSPLERWPCTISTDRPEMESRPYEFLLPTPQLGSSPYSPKLEKSPPSNEDLVQPKINNKIILQHS